MVKAFEFARSPRIIFGTGRIEELSPIVKAFGNDILLVTGKDSFLNSNMASICFIHLIYRYKLS
jgi:alcohol dehydrogenase YqhD (iron-dependent ADH family)